MTGKAPNQVYYFEIGRGEWEGRFGFQITSWKGFRSTQPSMFNSFLVLVMAAMRAIFGKARINSLITTFPNEGTTGVARNVVRIHYLFLTVYELHEEYILNPDGSGVLVKARDRFGPIPFLFRHTKEYSATIHAPGTSSTYYMPLLGSSWVCNYQVEADRNHVHAKLGASWAEASEVIHRINH